MNSLGKLPLLHTKQITRSQLNWFVTQREHRIWSTSSMSMIKIRPDQSGGNLPPHILLRSAASYRIKICTKVCHRNVIRNAHKCILLYFILFNRSPALSKLLMRGWYMIYETQVAQHCSSVHIGGGVSLQGVNHLTYSLTEKAHKHSIKGTTMKQTLYKCL